MVPAPLIVTADDFGHARGIDDAVADLAALNRVTGTSCLVRSPRWAEAAARARDLRGTIDLGLHFDLTEHDRLASLGRLVVASFTGGIDVLEVRSRLRAQLDAFEAAIGAAPDYLDGHQHVHQLRPVAPVLVEEISRRYGSRAPWVRVSLPAGGGAKARVISALGANALARRLDAAGIRHSRRLLGVYAFGAGDYGARMAAWLGAARADDALMVHPARAAIAGDPVGEARAREYRYLASPDFPARLASAGLAVARGSACLGTAA